MSPWWVVAALAAGIGGLATQARAQAPAPSAQRVVVISVDGLRPDLIQESGAASLPGFFRLMAEGAFTLNARVDPDYSVTLPNHVAMSTGRFTGGSGGHAWTPNVDPDPGETIHLRKGGYVASMFDVVHDRGGRTGMFATKTKFSLFDTSYNGVNGAPDTTGTDEGRDKIDVYTFRSSSSSLVDAFRTHTGENAFELAFLHFGEPDAAGHGNGWGTNQVSAYSYAVRLADRLISNVLDFVSTAPGYAGQTTVVVTTDHGGTGIDHFAPLDPLNYTIPVFVWGAGVEAGADLYQLNPTRVHPGSSHVDRAASLAAPPIRNGDAANLALSLLGLPAVPGSQINVIQDLRVASGGTPPSPLPPVAAFTSSATGLAATFDASGSADGDGFIASYFWTFGDGATGTGVAPTHTYLSPGTYSVSLTVTDNQELTDVVSAAVVVTESPTNQQTISFQNGVLPSANYAGTTDVKLLSDAAGVNFGDDVQLEADGFPPYTVLFRWDLADVPSNAGILDASVTLDITNVSVDAYALFAGRRAWNESAATWLEASAGQPWDSPGASGEDRGVDELARFAPSAFGSITIPMNAAGLQEIQRWVLDPASNHGFVLGIANSGSDGVDITSSESSNPALRPRLTVTYSTDPGQVINLPPNAQFAVLPADPASGVPALFDAGESFDPDGSVVSYAWDFGDGTSGTGVQATHTFVELGQYQVTLTVTDNRGAESTVQRLVVVLGETVASMAFQNGVAPTTAYQGATDTKILSDRPTDVFGGLDNLEIDGSPDYGGLLRWDLSSVPEGATILSASLSVTAFNSSPDTYELYELRRAWEESQATWRQAAAGAPWGSPGASAASDRSTAVAGRVRALTGGRHTFPLNEVGVAVLQKWVERPEDNFGFVLQDYAQASDGIDFFSSEATDPAVRPRLEIEYTMEGPGANRLTISSDAGRTVVFDSAVPPEFEDWTSAQVGRAAMVDPLMILQSREYRMIAARNTTALLAVESRDTIHVDRRQGAFELDRSESLAGVSWSLFTRTLARGVTSVDVPARARLFVTDPAAISVMSEVGAIGPEPGSDDLRAFPNPFDSELTVEFDGADQARLDVIDLLGRVVATIELRDGRATIPTGRLGPGTFILRARGLGVPEKSIVVTKAR